MTGISLNAVLRGQCSAPMCSRKTVEDAPFPICMFHMRKVFDYFDGFAELAKQVVAARYPVDPDEIRAEVLKANAEISRASHAKDEHSQVYYAEVNGAIKIGFTTNMKSRMGDMRITLDRVLATEPGGRDLEGMRHRQFAHLRRGRLEEFERAEDLLSHIAMIREHFGAPKITTWNGRVA